MKILFVCEYNRVRSLGAKIIAEAKVKKYSIMGLEIDSAGLRNPQLPRIKSEMDHVLSNLGYNCKNYHSKKISPALIQQQDLILCFRKNQVNHLYQPDLDRQKIKTLPEFVGIDDEIFDPEESFNFKEISGFCRWQNVPGFLYFNQIMGRVDPRDYDRIIELYHQTAKKIEKYVDLAFQKMIDEKMVAVRSLESKVVS